MSNVFPNRAAIAASQLEQLRTLIAAITPDNKFYSGKFKAAAVPANFTSLADFSARFPFTTKQELVDDQRTHPPYGTGLTYPMERYTRYHQTSGTSGVPLRWLDTPESWNWMVGNWVEIFRAAGVGASDRIFFAFSFGPFVGFWLAFIAGQRVGALCLPGGGLSSGARLRLMFDNEATVLCCTPTYAIRLAEVAAEDGIDMGQSRVKLIMVAGEPGGSIPATRNRLKELWRGPQVFDHHGMTEVGPVSFQCPLKPGVLHIMESGYYAEVLDPKTGKPVGAGQTGELILTNLGRTGSPLIRYRTGDIVKPVESPTATETKPCACGRHDLALEGGILGRVDDMIVVRGVNIYPSAVEEIIRTCGGVAEYQVVVTSPHALTEMHVTVEPAADCADTAVLARHLEYAFSSAFSLRIPVEIAAAGSLPRFEMKASRWVRR